LGFQKPSHNLAKIRLKALQTNRSHLLFTLSFTMFINILCYGQDDLPKEGGNVPINEKKNTSEETPLEIKSDSLIDSPTTTKEIKEKIKDTLRPKNKGLLTDIVKSKAKDYTSFNKKEQKLYLYNEAEVIYGDMEISAGSIVIDYNNNLVYAGRLKDSLGEYSQHPIFKQGQNIIEPDSIIFNTETQKALVYNSRTEQQGFNIRAPITKKENDSVYYMYKGRFTTSENKEDPEYEFVSSKVKLVPNKKIIVGPTHMEIYGVPTPIALPFAFFPLTEKQTSGIIFPSFGEDNNRGYFLQNGGYYFAISDYIDLAVLGDYYTNGSYGLRLDSRYNIRYKFNGNVGFRYENLLNSERGFPDFSQNTIYNIRWSHSQDNKANPNSRFTATVNLGSSSYYQQSINQVNIANSLNNTLNSSITYSKTFSGEPQANMTLTATHNQNTQTEVINLTLPTFQGSISRVYPFASKTGTKKGLIQNINIRYDVRGENRIETTDSLFFKKEMFDDTKIGMKHTIPLATNFKVFNYFSISANANYDEVWTLNTINRFFNGEENIEVTENLNKFDTFRTYNFGSSLGTTIYGTFDLDPHQKGKKIQKIRHVMRPSISYNINPAFDQYYEEFEVVDANGLTTGEIREFSRFEGNLFGSPNKTYSSSVGISISNNLEAKIRDRDTTKVTSKKVILLNNLNLSSAYNIAGDSLNWSPVRLSGGTQLFDNKMNINFGAELDPYALDNNNTKIDKFNINNGGSLFRLSSANLTLGYSFSSEGFKRDKNDEINRENNLQSGGRDDDLFGKSQDFSNQQFAGDDQENDQETTYENYNFKLPWTLRLAYALNYGNSRRQNEISSHSLMFSGDIDLSPKWSVGGSSGYDFKNQGFTFTQLRFARDLLSWRMNFSWIPFSPRTSWNFFIGIKSSVLKDIKYDTRRRPDQRL